MRPPATPPKRSRAAATASSSPISRRGRATWRGPRTRLAEAFAAALVDWPARGVPERPETWLLTVARRRMIDAGRRRQTAHDGAAHLRLMADELDAMARRRRGHPRRPPAADVRLRASGDRRRGPRAADPPDRARPRRRDDRVGVPRRAGDDGTTPGARQDQDQAGGHPVPRPRARGAARAAGDGAGSDLRRVRGGLERSRRHGAPASRPRRRGDLARTSRGGAPAGRGGGARPPGTDAPRRGPPPGAPLARRRLRAARRAGPDDVGRARHRGGGRALAARRHVRRDRALSIGSGGAVGARRPALHGPLGLAGDRPALRRARGPDRLAGRGVEPRGRDRRVPRTRGRARGARRARRRRRGSRRTSRTGQHARRCSRRRARAPPPTPPTSARSASRAIPPCATFLQARRAALGDG